MSGGACLMKTTTEMSVWRVKRHGCSNERSRKSTALTPGPPTHPFSFRAKKQTPDPNDPNAPNALNGTAPGLARLCCHVSRHLLLGTSPIFIAHLQIFIFPCSTPPGYIHLQTLCMRVQRLLILGKRQLWTRLLASECIYR